MEDAASRLDQEILRLRRELVRNDTKGHSCAQCNHISVGPFHKPTIEELDGSLLFQIDTTVTEMRELAASGCDFWTVLSDQLGVRVLQQTMFVQKHGVIPVLDWDTKIFFKSVF